VIEDMKFDMDKLCIDEVVLNLPMKHLCAKDCKGICQTCGTNLNRGECDCNKKMVDSRLEILGSLLD